MYVYSTSITFCYTQCKKLARLAAIDLQGNYYYSELFLLQKVYVCVTTWFLPLNPNVKVFGNVFTHIVNWNSIGFLYLGTMQAMLQAEARLIII